MKTLISLCLLVFTISNISAQDELTMDQELARMFELSGTQANYDVAITQMFSMLKTQFAGVDSLMWNDLEAEFHKDAIDELHELIIPVYKKHFTLEDVKALNTFYDSPAGRILISKTPMIMQESMQIGQEWGLKIGQEFAEKMKNEGH